VYSQRRKKIYPSKDVAIYHPEQWEGIDPELFQIGADKQCSDYPVRVKFCRLTLEWEGLFVICNKIKDKKGTRFSFQPSWMLWFCASNSVSDTVFQRPTGFLYPGEKNWSATIRYPSELEPAFAKLVIDGLPGAYHDLTPGFRLVNDVDRGDPTLPVIPPSCQNAQGNCFEYSIASMVRSTVTEAIVQRFPPRTNYFVDFSIGVFKNFLLTQLMYLHEVTTRVCSSREECYKLGHRQSLETFILGFADENNSKRQLAKSLGGLKGLVIPLSAIPPHYSHSFGIDFAEGLIYDCSDLYARRISRNSLDSVCSGEYIGIFRLWFLNEKRPQKFTKEFLYQFKM